MRQRIDNFYAKTKNTSCRFILIAFCLVQSIMRLWDADQIAPVNILSSDWYAVLMLGAAIGLLLTATSCYKRASYAGRLIAVYTLGLWLLLAFDIISAPISCGNAFIIALIAGHEVFYRAC